MREQRWYARMFAVGAMALTLYAPPSAPPQPGTGPGGSHYPHAAVTRHGPYWANGHYRNANYEYVIYTPAKPAPEVAPVVLFIHGWLAYRIDDPAQPELLGGMINPDTHQCQQTIYMASYNDKPAEKDDIFRILSQADPKDVQDADAPKSCKLESYAQTPSYEQ